MFYAPVLARGKLYVALLGNAFPGETPAGAAMVVAKVRAILNVHYRGGSQPDIVFTDRGQGFFAIANGKITSEYAGALREHGLRAFMGANAARQPGDLKELMLHETAVAWLTRRLTVTTPARAWEETPETFGARLKDAATYVNEHHVVGRCVLQSVACARAEAAGEGGRPLVALSCAMGKRKQACRPRPMGSSPLLEAIAEAASWVVSGDPRGVRGGSVGDPWP